MKLAIRTQPRTAHIAAFWQSFILDFQLPDIFQAPEPSTADKLRQLRLTQLPVTIRVKPRQPKFESIQNNDIFGESCVAASNSAYCQNEATPEMSEKNRRTVRNL